MNASGPASEAWLGPDPTEAHPPAEMAAGDGTHSKSAVLVTGAGGLIGRRLVTRLLSDGVRVRALVRRTPNAAWLTDTRVDIVHGDLRQPDAVRRAVVGIQSVIHLGAATKGPPESFEPDTVQGTRNVVEAVLSSPGARLVYVSSLSVLHSAIATSSDVITETWPVEPRPSERGHYTRAKVAAELEVRAAARNRGLKVVVVRPGEVVSSDAAVLTAGIAQRVGRAIVVLGDGRLSVPVVAIDDLVDALVAAQHMGPFDGTVVHVLDPTQVSQNEMVRVYTKASPGRTHVLHVPASIVRGLGLAGDLSEWLSGHRSPISSYRLTSALAARRFGSTLAKDLWKWAPRVGVLSTLERLPESVHR